MVCLRFVYALFMVFVLCFVYALFMFVYVLSMRFMCEYVCQCFVMFAILAYVVMLVVFGYGILQNLRK